MRVNATYQHLVVHTPVPKFYDDELEDLIWEKGVTQGPSEDSERYRRLLFPKGNERLAEKVMVTYVGYDYPCRVEILGGFCGDHSEMVTAESLESTLFTLTSEPCPGVALFRVRNNQMAKYRTVRAERQLNKSRLLLHMVEQYKELKHLGTPACLTDLSDSDLSDSLRLLWEQAQADRGYSMYAITRLTDEMAEYRHYIDALYKEYGIGPVDKLLNDVNMLVDLPDDEIYENVLSVKSDVKFETDAAMVSQLTTVANQVIDGGLERRIAEPYCSRDFYDEAFDIEEDDWLSDTEDEFDDEELDDDELDSDNYYADDDDDDDEQEQSCNST